MQFDTSIYHNIFARDSPYWVCTLILCKMKTTKHEPILHWLDNDFELGKVATSVKLLILYEC